MRYLLIPLLLTGCMASQPTKPTVVNADWVPAQGAEWAQADCAAKTQAVGGYDLIDASLRRAEFKASCLKAYGLR